MGDAGQGPFVYVDWRPFFINGGIYAGFEAMMVGGEVLEPVFFPGSESWGFAGIWEFK